MYVHKSKWCTEREWTSVGLPVASGVGRDAAGEGICGTRAGEEKCNQDTEPLGLCEVLDLMSAVGEFGSSAFASMDACGTKRSTLSWFRGLQDERDPRRDRPGWVTVAFCIAPRHLC
jgi:hypothetical protein